MAARGGGWPGLGETGEGGQRSTLPVIRQISPGDVMYSMVTTVNNTVLYI